MGTFIQEILSDLHSEKKAAFSPEKQPRSFKK